MREVIAIMCREGPDVEFWGPVMAGVCFFVLYFSILITWDARREA